MLMDCYVRRDLLARFRILGSTFRYHNRLEASSSRVSSPHPPVLNKQNDVTRSRTLQATLTPPTSTDFTHFHFSSLPCRSLFMFFYISPHSVAFLRSPLRSLSRVIIFHRVTSLTGTNIAAEML